MYGLEQQNKSVIFSAHIEKHEEELEQEKNEERLMEENFGDTWLGTFRSYFWDMLEYPETSKGAQAIAFTSMMFVFLSTITFLVESNLEHDYPILTENVEFLNTTIFAEKDSKVVLRITQTIDHLAISFFTIEYLLRFILCPRKTKFFFDKMNLVDFIAIIPFYIALLLEGLEDMEIIGKAGKIIRLIRSYLIQIHGIFGGISNFVTYQNHENTPDLQDGPALRGSAEPGVHAAPGVPGPGPHPPHRGGHRPHVLQPRLRLRERK